MQGDKVWHPHFCSQCGIGGTFQCCSLCKSVCYCSVECQRKAWPTHKGKSCESEAIQKAAEAVGAQWFKDGSFDKISVSTGRWQDLLEAGILSYDRGHVEWKPHRSFGDYFAAKAEVARIVKIVNTKERNDAVTAVTSKYPKTDTCDFGTFFAESWADEVERRGF